MSKLQFGQRKVRKMRYSHAVFLPPEWIKTMNVQKGDLLSIELDDDNALRIVPVLKCETGTLISEE